MLEVTRCVFCLLRCCAVPLHEELTPVPCVSDKRRSRRMNAVHNVPDDLSTVCHSHLLDQRLVCEFCFSYVAGRRTDERMDSLKLRNQDGETGHSE